MCRQPIHWLGIRKIFFPFNTYGSHAYVNIYMFLPWHALIYTTDARSIHWDSTPARTKNATTVQETQTIIQFRVRRQCECTVTACVNRALLTFFSRGRILFNSIIQLLISDNYVRVEEKMNFVCLEKWHLNQLVNKYFLIWNCIEIIIIQRILRQFSLRFPIQCVDNMMCALRMKNKK